MGGFCYICPMANFIQLDFRNAETGAAITTVYLQDDEVPNGVNRNEAGQIIESRTTNGKSRTWLKPDGVQFSWEIVISRNTTISTLDQIWDLISLGRICDVKVLSGMVTGGSGGYPVYSVTNAVLLNGVITAFKNDWRQAVAMGQVATVRIPMVVRQSAGFALPSAVNWVGN